MDFPYNSLRSANTRARDDSVKEFLWWGAAVWGTWAKRMLFKPLPGKDKRKPYLPPPLLGR